MSLVNKMLRDLDARRAGEGERAALPAAVTPLAAHREPGSRLWWWLAALPVAAVLGAAWFATQGEAPALPPPAPAPAAKAPAPATEAGTSAVFAEPSLRMTEDLSALPALRAKAPAKAEAAASRKPDQPGMRAAAPGPTVVAPPKVPPLAEEGRIDKQLRLPSPAERAETEYRRGVLAQRQGKVDDAAGSYRAALEGYPAHAAARQTLAALLMEVKRLDEAEELLRKGAELPEVRLASTLALARLKVERNQAPAALELLQKYAAAGEHSAEYQGFAGALLNRAGRAAEAVNYYLAATRLAPAEARWWAGLGIALDAAGKSAEAREAYQKAHGLPGLPPDLALHVDQRLR
ncbi:MAG: tetratricopeptide repeat protein [Rhodocyclales bacterium]|nr:tetratricopeptide repeat protein [Rhodocyclales bacterium]